MSGWEQDVVSDGGFEVLASDDGEEREPRNRHLGRWAAIGGAALAVVGLAGGGWFAYSALSGGGTQPESVVPSTAAAYAELDLDPAAGQKIAAFRFLRRFPNLGKTLSSTKDLGNSLAGAAFDGSASDEDSVSFDRDLKPWVGSRAAVAIVPTSGGKYTYELAVQVKDEPLARDLLTKLAAKNKKSNADNEFTSDDGLGVADDVPSSVVDTSPEGWVIQDGYAILAPTQQEAEALAKDAAAASLADDKGYGDDVRSLGDHVASLWVDGDALAQLHDAGLSDYFPFDLTGVDRHGRTALALKFSSSAAEVVGWTTSSSGGGTGHTAQLASLPGDTAVGVEVTGASAEARRAWTAYAKLLDSIGDGGSTSGSAQLEKDYGLTLPEDLESLLGTDFLVAVGSPAKDATPYAVRATVPPAAAAHLVAASKRAVEGADFIPFPFATQTPTGVAWGDGSAYDKGVGHGSLGRSDGFRAALPDIARATWAVYIDFGQLSPSSKDAATAHLGTLGVTVTPSTEDAGRRTIHARLTTR